MAPNNVFEIPEISYEDGIWRGRRDEMPEGYFKLGERILKGFKDHPDFIGQIYAPTGEKNTFKRLADRSVRCALWLTKQGVRRGDVVGLCTKNQLDCCIPLLASLYIGSICSPLVHHLDKELIEHYLKSSKPKVMFVDEDNASVMADTAAKVGHSMTVVLLGEHTDMLSFSEILQGQTDEEVEEFKCTEVNAEDFAVIINTTGSTGMPKGVIHFYRSIANMMKYFDNDDLPSTVMGFFEISFISGMRMIIRSLIFKATLIITLEPFEEEIFSLIEKYKVTRLWMPIYAAVKLRNTPDLRKYDFSSVEMVTYGGSIADRESVEFFHRNFKKANFFTRYSATESGAMLSAEIPPNRPEYITSAGKVMPNVEVKVVHPVTKAVLGPNEEGEIHCRTPKLMAGYWENQKATEEAVDSEGWYNTRDFGYYNKDGYFYILDRLNDYIICDGHIVKTSQLVRTIKRVAGVAEVAVVAKRHAVLSEVPAAFIVADATGVPVTKDDINAAVENELPDFMKLRGGIHFLDKLPLSWSGKIHYRILRLMANSSNKNYFDFYADLGA